MSTAELSAAFRNFVDRYMMTIDHVAVILSLRDSPAEARTKSWLADGARLEHDVVDRVLADLVRAHLVRREGQSFVYDPPAEMGALVDELSHWYRTMPVTLIRAIYARPVPAAKSFADAFRLRPGVE